MLELRTAGTYIVPVLFQLSCSVRRGYFFCFVHLLFVESNNFIRISRGGGAGIRVGH